MSRSNSDLEELYYDADDGELDNFIVSDEDVEKQQESGQEEGAEEDQQDRILNITNVLKPNETQTQKLLKAHISVLVSALGGPDHTSDISPPPYKLGHDALACLKDIKRWIKSVDEKNNSFDVALACADSGLVVNDLIVILCQWDKQQTSKTSVKNVRTMEKIMLSCLELLVLLTWPIEISKESSDNQKLNFPNVKKTQIIYKKHILSYNKGQTLKATIRLALPTISKNKIDREPRDNAILRLVLFFIRNIVYTEPADSSISTKSTKGVTSLDNMPAGVTYDDISINTVLSVFKKNKVLMLLLTISGSIGNDFDRETFVQPCLECIYLIIKGIKPKDILNTIPSKSNNTNPLPPQQQKIGSITTTAGLQLQDLLKEESTRKKFQTQNLSTRHGRFGTLLSIQDYNTSYVISGQEALLDANSTLEKLDKTKKWNSRSQFKYDSDEFVKTPQVFLSCSAILVLKEFIDQFLVGGCFNNLIEGVSWLLSGATDLNYIDEYEKAAYFLTVSWFFNYKRERTILYKNNILNSETLTDDDDKLDYGSVGAGLSEVNFILIISYFRESYELRRWNSLHVAMICFRELLLISNSIFSEKKESNDNGDDYGEDQHSIDRELAEGIIRKLFSFSDFLNIIIQIPKTAAKHSPDYLGVCISVVHIILKSFESFANEDIKLYIQTKRKRSRLNKKTINNLDKSTEDSLRDIIDGSDDEFNEGRVKEVTRERKLDFKVTEVKFFQTPIISAYIEYLSRYEDLSHEEIKRCLSYFHRLFVIRKDFTGLYRIDFMLLLFKLKNYLPKGSSIRGHVEEFVYYFMKKFKSAFERFPNPIEVLFSRFDSLEFNTYLGTGELHIKPESLSKKPNPRLAKDIEFIRDNFTIDDKFKILISALYQQEKDQFISWLITELDRILAERLLDATSKAELKPNSQISKLLINNSNIRLLLSLIGFELPYILEEICELSYSTSNEKIVESLNLIKKWKSNQPIQFEDNKDASYFLRPKETFNENNDIDYNGDYDEDDDSIAFETTANSNGDRRNLEELDKLDELEAALDYASGRSKSSRGNLPKGVARTKKRRPHKNTSANESGLSSKNKQSKGRNDGLHRRRRPFSLMSDDEGDDRDKNVKSAEYIHDSDDESDEEKDNVFFEREERLRQLLRNVGNIVNSEQLVEFKKAWVNLERSNGENTVHSVANAIQKTSLFVNESDNYEENSDQDKIHKTREGPVVREITKETALEDNMESTSSESGSIHDSEDKDRQSPENINLHIPFIEHKNLKKRTRLVIEGSDDEDNEDTIGDYVSAREYGEETNISGPTRKRRLVISDEEDND